MVKTTTPTRNGQKEPLSSIDSFSPMVVINMTPAKNANHNATTFDETSSQTPIAQPPSRATVSAHLIHRS